MTPDLPSPGSHRLAGRILLAAEVVAFAVWLAWEMAKDLWTGPYR